MQYVFPVPRSRVSVRIVVCPRKCMVATYWFKSANTGSSASRECSSCEGVGSLALERRKSRETRNDTSLISGCNSRQNILSATMLESPPAASVLNHRTQPCQIQPYRPQPLAQRRYPLFDPQVR